MRFVDLSHPLQSGMAPLTLKPHPTKPITIVEVPALIQGGKRIDRLPVSSFFKSAVLLDLTSKRRSEVIDDEDLEAAEEAAGLAVREGEVVLLWTGWEKYAGMRGYGAGFPSLSRNAVEYLLFREVSGVAVDCPSVDSDQKLTVHRALFRGGVLVIENLRNVEMIAQSRFQLIFFPLKVKAGRSAVRVVAVVDDSQ